MALHLFLVCHLPLCHLSHHFLAIKGNTLRRISIWIKKETAKNKETQSETGTQVQDLTDGKVSIVAIPHTQQEPDRHKIVNVDKK